MKAISSALVVVCGTAMLIAATAVSTWSRDGLWWLGILTSIVGIAGWAYSLMREK